MGYSGLPRPCILARKKIQVDASWAQEFAFRKVTRNGPERENPMKSQYEIIPQVVCDLRLEGEELEVVVAPGFAFNHNEAFLAIPEELEAAVAPGVTWNHNEAFLAIPEELEAVAAPGRNFNHNETFLAVST